MANLITISRHKNDQPEVAKPVRKPGLGRSSAVHEPYPGPFAGSILRAPIHAQAKLSIGAPNDAFEREAEQIAERLLRADPAEPRLVTDAPRGVQRLCGDCEEDEITAGSAKTLQRSSASGVNNLSHVDAMRIQRLHGGGAALPTSVRSDMEGRFGRDFGAVRIHTDAKAGSLARSVRSHAFTLGSDIVFAPGKFAPRTYPGRRLLAHELTHVVQQGKAPPRGPEAQPASPTPSAPYVARAPAAAPGKTAASQTDSDVPTDLFIATVTGTLDQVPNLIDRIAVLNYEQSLKLYRDVEYYLNVIRRYPRKTHEMVRPYQSALSMLENRVGKISAHRAYTRPSLSAESTPGTGETAFEGTVSAVYGALKPKEKDFFDHLYPVVRLDLDYLLAGEQVPKLSVIERPYYGYLSFDTFNKFSVPDYEPIALSDLAPEFEDPAATIALLFVGAAEGKSTADSIARRIGEEYKKMHKAWGDMRRVGAGSCEQGSSKANGTRVCKMISMVLCMAGDGAFLYSTLGKSSQDDSCRELLQK